MSQAEAIAFALGESRPPPSPAGLLHEQGRPHLTGREQEVAALIVQGMTNSEIAAALVISARTVETHVQHIMNKLGCGTRAQIAAWVASGPASPPSAGNR
jgi:DNA-binding NarL/FixJ family response regulator